MRSHLLSLGRQSLIYGLSGAAIQAVGLVTLPVYARTFTAAQYGVIELATVAFTALIVAVDAGLGAAMARDYYEIPEEDVDERRTILATATITSVAWASALAVVLIVARHPVSDFIFGTPEHADVVVLTALSVVAGTLAIFLREVMRLHFWAWRFAASSFVGAGGAGLIGVIWVVAFDGSGSAVIAALLIGQVAAAIYGLAAGRSELGLRFSGSRLRRLLSFGLPLLPAAVALWGVNFIDRVVLSRLDSLAAVGQYAVASRFAAVLLFFTGAFSTAYMPFTFSLHVSEPERERELRAVLLTYTSGLYVWLALALTLFSAEIVDIIAPDYGDAYRVVGILCLGAAAFGLTPITGIGLSLMRRTKYAMYYTWFALLLSVGICWATIPSIGLTGAALGTSSAYVAIAALYLYRSQQLSRVDFHLPRVVAVFVLGAALMPVGLLQLEPQLLEFACKLSALLLFSGLMVPLGVFGRAERDEVRRAIQALRARRLREAGGAT